MEVQKNIIFDTDPGIDDVIAITALTHLFCAQTKLFVSTFGNVSGETTHRNLKNLLALLGTDTPILRGSICALNTPLSGDAKSADHFHGQNGLGGITLPQTAQANDISSEQPFEDTLYQTILQHAPITYIAVGPLTNLARLIMKYPDSKKYITQVYCMGGGLNLHNSPGKSEFNFHADPAAAQAVIQSGLDIRLFPLDTTHEVIFSDLEIAQITGVRREETLDESNRRRLIAAIFYASFDAGMRYQEGGAVMHDLMPVASLANGITSIQEAISITVNTDGRTKKTADGNIVQLVKGFNKKQIAALLQDIFAAL